MKKRPDFTNMKTREILEHLFDELEEEEEESKEQLYEWRSEPNACKKCAKHDGKFFTLEEAPIMHPNCKCDLVATINCKKVTMPVGELSKKKYEEQKAKSHKTVDAPSSDKQKGLARRQTNSKEQLKKQIQNVPNEMFDKINIFEFLKKIYNVGDDMIGNYVDMRYDNTEGNDNYFHCRANFDAAKRGLIEAVIAIGVNHVKEFVDFPKNIIFRGLSLPEAIKDFNHDMSVDNDGLFRGLKAKENETARKACHHYRVNGINPRY